MLPGLIGIAAATVALASGHGRDHAPHRAAMLEPAVAPTPTPAPARPPPPRAVRLTIGGSGDLLPHLPIVARPHVLAGGGGGDFPPAARPPPGWARDNSP